MNFIKEGSFYFFQKNNILYLIASSFNASLKNDEKTHNRLKEMKFEGEVYIDMLLTKGASPTRFMSCYFNGKKFESRKTKVLDSSQNIVQQLRTIEMTFCKKNKNLVEGSILSDTEKLIAYGHEV